MNTDINKIDEDLTSDDSAKILRAVSRELGFKRVPEFGAALGIGKQQIYDYTGGKISPQWRIWTRIKSTFPQVSSDFLLTGKGSVLIE